MKQRKGRNDEAISVIVGAVMLLAILVAALIAFRLTYVPVAGERAEHEHMKEVSKAMGSLNAEILDGAQAESGALFPTGIPMTADYPPLVPGPPPGGTLEFVPEERNLTVQANELVMFTRNGQPLAGDDWAPVTGSETRSNIEEALMLQVKLLISDPGAMGPGDGFEVRIEDAQGESAGRLEVRESASDAVDLHVYDPQGARVYFERVYDDVTNDFQNEHRFDLLASTYGFQALVHQAPAPFSFTFEETGPLNIEYAIVYREDAGGITRLTGHGDNMGPYEETYPTGTLSYATAYQFFVRQSFVLDHGGLITEQLDGSVFTVEPPLSVDATSQLATVHLLAPSVTGDAFSISGGDRAEVQTAPQGTQRFHASVDQLTLTFTTAFPDEWDGFLTETFQQAGLDGTAYDVTTSTSRVQATLHGPQGAGTHDIGLTFIQGENRARVTR